jgi:hypothetical protein
MIAWSLVIRCPSGVLRCQVEASPPGLVIPATATSGSAAGC